MEIKKNLYRGFCNWGLPVLLPVFLFASCKDDLQTSVCTGPGISFSVSDGTLWHVTRAAGNPEEENTPPDSLLGVLPLQAGDGGDGLYLHALLSDNTGNTLRGSERVETRSAPVTDMETYGNFGVFAYLYQGAWDGSATPDFMYNTEVRGEGGVWSPTADYNWPGKGKKLRFFAYAPYNAQGIVVPAPNEAGSPSLACTVPDEVDLQKDLLVAASGELAGDHNAMAPLAFRHALTSVRFVVGDDMQKGRVTKITLRGVYGKAVYNMDDDSWSGFAEIKDFSQSLDKEVNGQSGEEITPAACTFMMIPQGLPENAEIEVVFTDDMTGTERTLKASIAATTWSQGKRVTYRISTSSISIVPTFSVTAPADFTYAGGSNTYSVTSYASVSRPGDATKTVAVAWTAEFIEDDGMGGYTVISRPDWLTAFTTSDAGSTAGSSFPATVAAQQGVTFNPHNDVLKAAAPVSGTYDLATQGGTATMNTANCYVINAPGRYSLPLVYGNAVKNGITNSSAYTSTASGSNVLQTFVNHLDAPITDPYIYNNADCTPNNAVLLWQDEQNLVTDVALSSGGKSLTFEVGAATIKQGNALVAVRDASNRIMWSWHIWVTDFVPGLPPTVTPRYEPSETQRDKVVTNHQGVKYTFMGVNIGWCDAETTIYDARSVKVRFTQTTTGVTQVITLTQASYTTSGSGNQTYFQFGRKDPMLPGVTSVSGSVVDKDCYSDSGYAFEKSGTGKITIATSILNPHVFYNDGDASPYDWCSTSYTNNFWNADNTVTNANNNTVVKTIYDPSPSGYCLPPSNVFRGFTSNGTAVSGLSSFGSRFNSPHTSTTNFTDSFGWEFYCNKMMGEGSYDIAGGTVFLPGSGMRSNTTGAAKLVGSNGVYWTAGPHPLNGGYSLFFYSASVYPVNSYSRACGFTVRPVREK